MLRSAHFVFWTRCAASSRNRLLFCPLYWWPGLQMGTADRAAAKKTDTPGLRPVSYGEPRRQLNSHNGKEYLPFRGSTRRSKRRACQGRTDAVRSGRRNRYRQIGMNLKIASLHLKRKDDSQYECIKCWKTMQAKVLLVSFFGNKNGTKGTVPEEKHCTCTCYLNYIWSFLTIMCSSYTIL